MQAFLKAVRTRNPRAVLTGTEESLRTHLITFAAERARREGRVVAIAELAGEPVPAVGRREPRTR